MKVIVAGGRDFVPLDSHREWLEEKLFELGCSEEVCGEAVGADAFGKEVAESLSIPVKSFPAKWNLHGNAADTIRNGEMARYADACILLPGGRGTANMKQQAIENNLHIIEYEED
jgi:hypothetical protein